MSIFKMILFVLHGLLIFTCGLGLCTNAANGAGKVAGSIILVVSLATIIYFLML